MRQAIIIGEIDMLLITESKLDNSFPSNQFYWTDLFFPGDLIEIKTLAGHTLC